MTAQAILAFGLILIALVVIHELGHFITAKLTGIKVLEFGIGYPPRLWAFRKGETEYSVNLLPLGGFVRLLGEEDPSDPRSLAARPAWNRLLVLGAGSGMNFVLPIFLFALSFMIPHDVDVGLTRIARVAPGSPAAEGGLKAGDIIFAINGDEVRNVNEVGRAIRLNLGEDLNFKVKTDGEFREVEAKARWSPPDGQGPTGIEIGPLYPFTERESLPFWDAIPSGYTATIDSLTLARNEIISWFRGRSAPEVAGPVGLAEVTDEVVDEAGYRALLDFAALLSINLAIINVLPLPMLDGGRMAFVLLEILRRGKRIAPDKEALVHFIGFAVMISLAVIVTYFDVLRMIRGESLFR